MLTRAAADDRPRRRRARVERDASTRSRIASCGSTAGRSASRPAFTVLDQADGADVMNLLREELGFAARGAALPAEGHARLDPFARRQRRGASWTTSSKRHYPWCVDDVDGIRQIFRAYVERKRAQQTLDYDDLLLFWKALGVAEPLGPQLARDVRPRPGRRVPGHERAAGRHPRGACGRPGPTAT